MPSSTPALKFLLDENVRIELFKFLRRRGFDVLLTPKSTSDKQVASISQANDRILVTNDEDFTEYSKEEIFSVVWLRLPQNDPRSLDKSFEKLITELKDFEGRLIVLEEETWKDLPLIKKIII